MGEVNRIEENKTQEFEFDEHWDDFTLRESAIDTMAIMLGFNMNDIRNEEAKDTPDFAKIKELEEEGDRLYDERNRIYFGDKELMRYVRDYYNPIIRKRYGFDKGE